MSLDNIDLPKARGGAEETFRKAFERLRANCPELLPHGTPVSQNNVAKEAGCSASALRKERFPRLVAEIQQYVNERQSSVAHSRQKAAPATMPKRGRTNEDQQALERQTYETSRVLSLLAEVADLRRQLLTLEQRLAEGKISPLNHSS